MRALGTVRTDVTTAAAIFAAFVDALVFAVAIAAVMDATNGCMRLAKAAAEYSTTGIASAYESSFSYLFSIFVALSSNVGMINCSK